MVLDRIYPVVENLTGELGLERIIVTGVNDYLPIVKRVLGSLLGSVPSYDV